MAIALVVEDDAVSRALIGRALSAISGLTVVTAGSVGESKVLLETVRPDLLVLDLMLQDGLGFEVLDLLDSRGGVSMVIVVSSFLQEHRERLPTGGRVQCLDKPIDVERVQSLARQHLADRCLSAERDSSPFSPAEYVQLAGMGGHSVSLQCRSYPDSKPLGLIQVANGRIRVAIAGSLAGSRAFHFLITHPAARASVSSLADLSLAPNLDQDWQRALLETLRFEDERNAGRLSDLPANGFASLLPEGASGPCKAPAEAPPSPVGAVAPEEGSMTLRLLVDEAVRAVIDRDYDTAIGCLERAHAIAPHDRTVKHRLDRLYATQSEQGGEDGEP